MLLFPRTVVLLDYLWGANTAGTALGRSRYAGSGSEPAFLLGQLTNAIRTYHLYWRSEMSTNSSVNSAFVNVSRRPSLDCTAG
jgi:hypothetical protein